MSGVPPQLQNTRPPEPVTIDVAQLESYKCFTIHKCLNCGNLVTVPSFKIPSSLLHFDPRMPTPDYAIAYMPNEKYICPICGSFLVFAHFVKQNTAIINAEQSITKNDLSNDVS
jgi:hypothetical protein